MVVGALSSSAPVVVASIGACGSGGSTLLNELFHTSLPVAPRRGVQTTLGVAEAEASSSQAVVLDVEGFDSRDRSRAEDQTLAMKWAFCVADVVIYNIRFTDLGRSDGLPVAGLGACVEEELRLRASGVLPSAGAGPKLLLVAVRDWDGAGLSREELVEAYTSALEAMLEGVPLPEGSGPLALTDVFDVHFALLPHRQLCRAQWDDSLGDVAALLEREVTAAAEGASAGGRSERAADVWSALSAGEGDALSGAVEVPPESELTATYACEATMKAVEGRYLRNVQPWKVDTGAGRLVRDFGRQAGETLEQTLDAFSADAAAHGTTEAVRRKREELRGTVLTDLHSLYAKQLVKLRELAYQVFRDNLARIRISASVEKDVDGAIKVAEKFFVSKANELVVPGSGWRYDALRSELVKHMREDATERLQSARLSGVYTKPVRFPVALSLHYLAASVAGLVDSRLPQKQPTEDVTLTDPNRLKLADLSRLYPHSLPGAAYTIGGGDLPELHKVPDLGDGVVDD